MALIAEEVVEEWLNRQGFFTIRGIKLGVHEIDILALRPRADGTSECRHVEVQVSSNPIGYVCRVPKRIQKKLKIGPNSVRRRDRYEMEEAVKEWVARKFDHPRKVELRAGLARGLAPGTWTRELVINRVRFPEEVEIFKQAGVTIHYLKSIVDEMTSPKDFPIDAASGCDLLLLMNLLENSKGNGLDHLAD